MRLRAFRLRASFTPNKFGSYLSRRRAHYANNNAFSPVSFGSRGGGSFALLRSAVPDGSPSAVKLGVGSLCRRRLAAASWLLSPSLRSVTGRSRAFGLVLRPRSGSSPRHAAIFGVWASGLPSADSSIARREKGLSLRGAPLGTERRACGRSLPLAALYLARERRF